VIPLKDTVRARGFPYVTAALIGANILLFFVELRLPPDMLEAFLWLLGVVPRRFLTAPWPNEWLTLLTSQFLHGGWFHLLSNMLALVIFADNVEDRLGHWRFLLFYLVCGIAAALLHIWFNPLSNVPAIGASGAISGVLAAYLVLFPAARVVALVPVFFIPWFVEVPAIIWVGGWFLAQLLNGLLSLASDMELLGGVAWWAHVGGFLAGLVLVWPLRRPAPQYHPDQYWPW
jgi:membrane associated rhomboid family serine protease